MKTKQDLELYLAKHLNDLFVLVGRTTNEGLPAPVWKTSSEDWDYTETIKCLREVEKVGLEYDDIRELPGWEVLNTILDHIHLLD